MSNASILPNEFKFGSPLLQQGITKKNPRSEKITTQELPSRDSNKIVIPQNIRPYYHDLNVALQNLNPVHRRRRVEIESRELISKFINSRLLAKTNEIRGFVNSFPKEDRELAKKVLMHAFPYSNFDSLNKISQMIADNVGHAYILDIDHDNSGVSLTKTLRYLLEKKNNRYYKDNEGNEQRLKQKLFRSDHEKAVLIIDHDVINTLRNSPELVNYIKEKKVKLWILDGLNDISNPYSFSFEKVKQRTKELVEQIKELKTDITLDEIPELVSNLTNSPFLIQLEKLRLDSYAVIIKQPSEEQFSGDSFKKISRCFSSQYTDFSKVQLALEKFLKPMSDTEKLLFLEFYNKSLVTLNHRDITDLIGQALEKVELHAEKLGIPKENIVFYTPEECSLKSLSIMNLILFEKFGINKTQFQHSASDILNIDNKLIVMLDDFAGSGTSVIDMTTLFENTYMKAFPEKDFSDSMVKPCKFIAVNLLSTDYAHETYLNGAQILYPDILHFSIRRAPTVLDNNRYFQISSEEREHLLGFLGFPPNDLAGAHGKCQLPNLRLKKLNF